MGPNRPLFHMEANRDRNAANAITESASAERYGLDTQACPARFKSGRSRPSCFPARTIRLILVLGLLFAVLGHGPLADHLVNDSEFLGRLGGHEIVAIESVRNRID